MFQPIRFILFAFLLMGLFLSLGQWQLHRAASKREMLAAFELRSQAKPVLWHQAMQNPFPYQRIQLMGYYDAHYFLLDNQYAAHQWGYHVLSVLRLLKGGVVIVDRGWVSGKQTRRELPDITTPQTLQKVTGHVYYPQHNRMIGRVEPHHLSETTWLIAEFNQQQIQTVLRQPVPPFIVRLDKDADGGFLRDWKVVTLSPERHIGYAVQWFALACLVLVGSVALLWKKKNV